MRAVDLFAGAGGFSEGARMAGLEVVWAANHWPVAVEWHAANHPDTGATSISHHGQNMALRVVISFSTSGLSMR